MKKLLVAIGVVIAGAGIWLTVASGRLPWLGLALDGDKRALHDLAADFLEDLQYKDFDAAATFHTAEDQAKADIPKLIENMFKVKPELLNIRDIHVNRVTLDRDKKRGRTFFVATTELLNSAKQGSDESNLERRVEGILYWHKLAADGQPERWYLMLESSLH